MSYMEWSELIRNYVTAIGIAVGGGWAFWKWGYSDWAGAKRNRASLDGQLSAIGVRLSDASVLVTIQALWCNRGAFSIPIDTQESRVLVFKLPSSLPHGPFEPEIGLGQALYVQKPFERLDSFELEPKTESSLRAHFVLQEGETYFFRWELQQSKRRKSISIFFWSKELVWQVPKN